MWPSGVMLTASFNEAAGSYPRKRGPCRNRPRRYQASMRPREATRGNVPLRALVEPAAHASMRPREATRGNFAGLRQYVYGYDTLQ